MAGTLDEQRERGVAAARAALADQHLRQNQAERIDVGALIDLLAGRLLRRHVGQRPDDRAGRGGERARRRRARDPEVGDDRLLGVVDEDVGGLQIAVHDAHLVRGAQAGHHLARKRQGSSDGQLPFGREQTRQIGAVHERHRDVLDAVDLAEVVNADDVGVRDLAREHQLALEAALELLRRQRVRVRLDHLQRQRQRQLRIPDVVDRAHPADAEQADDLIALTEGLSGNETGRGAAGRERIHERNGHRFSVGRSARPRRHRRRQDRGRDRRTRQRGSANGAASS